VQVEPGQHVPSEARSHSPPLTVQHLPPEHPCPQQSSPLVHAVPLGSQQIPSEHGRPPQHVAVDCVSHNPCAAEQHAPASHPCPQQSSPLVHAVPLGSQQIPSEHGRPPQHVAVDCVSHSPCATEQHAPASHPCPQQSSPLVHVVPLGSQQIPSEQGTPLQHGSVELQSSLGTMHAPPPESRAAPESVTRPASAGGAAESAAPASAGATTHAPAVHTCEAPHVAQALPPAPQSLLLVPFSQRLAEQQPLGHAFASHVQTSFTHSWPPAHEPAPQTPPQPSLAPQALPAQLGEQLHVPLAPQTSGALHPSPQHGWPLPPHAPHAALPHAVPVAHAVQSVPPCPQAVAVSPGSQTLWRQQPGHDVASHVHTPLVQRWPVAHVPSSQIPPQPSPAPHA